MSKITSEIPEQNKPKIIMAPVNIVGQPDLLVNALAKQGQDIRLELFANAKQGTAFGAEQEKLILREGIFRDQKQLKLIRNLLDEEVDIFHFWWRSFFFNGVYDGFTGADIPILRSYGRIVLFQFVGEDLRTRDQQGHKNPWSAYNYGYTTKTNEVAQRKYLDFIFENTDQLIVQNPELAKYCPDAHIIPEAIDLTELNYSEPIQKRTPVILHDVSNPVLSGTSFVRKAVAALRDEGIKFTYTEIKNSNPDLLRNADIVVDQLHTGWYSPFAVEAMARGKTVISYILDELLTFNKIPIPVVQANPDTIKQSLRMSILDYEMRKELGRSARAYVEDIHDLNIVSSKLKQLYGTHSKASTSRKEQYPLLDYFEYQIELIHKKMKAMGVLSDNSVQKTTHELTREFKIFENQLANREQRLERAKISRQEIVKELTSAKALIKKYERLLEK